MLSWKNWRHFSDWVCAMLTERLGGFIDGIFSAFPFVCDHGLAFCAGVMLGVVIGGLVPLSVFVSFKIDKRMEEVSNKDKGDNQ